MTDNTREALLYIKHQAEQMRVWDGRQWHYHPLQAKRIFEKAEEALSAIATQEAANG